MPELFAAMRASTHSLPRPQCTGVRRSRTILNQARIRSLNRNNAYADLPVLGNNVSIASAACGLLNK
jgi:hypothetical protein